MRLDEKPYPGEPITVEQVVDAVSIEAAGYGEAGFVSGFFGDVSDYRQIPANMPLGYDALCPDWRERLGRVVEMISTFLAEAGENANIRLDASADCEKATMKAYGRALAIIHDAFGLEEES